MIAIRAVVSEAVLKSLTEHRSAAKPPTVTSRCPLTAVHRLPCDGSSRFLAWVCGQQDDPRSRDPAHVRGAEDVAAETFRITWAHHQSGGDLSLPWVYKVLRNIIGNEYQRVARSTELFSRIGGLSGDSSYRMETADALDVRRALAGLRETDREILYMAYWEDLTRAEIASILGISTVTVRVRLLRARQTLKALLYNAVEDAHSEEVKDGRA